MHPGKPGNNREFFYEISITAEKYKINFCSTPKQFKIKKSLSVCLAGRSATRSIFASPSTLDGLKAKMSELLPRSARPPILLSRLATGPEKENRPEIEFSLSSFWQTVDEIDVSQQHCVCHPIYFGFNLP